MDISWLIVFNYQYYILIVYEEWGMVISLFLNNQHNTSIFKSNNFFKFEKNIIMKTKTCYLLLCVCLASIFYLINLYYSLSDDIYMYSLSRD